MSAVAVTAERVNLGHYLVARGDSFGGVLTLTTEEAAALVAALLADPEVHALFLHGKKP